VVYAATWNHDDVALKKVTFTKYAHYKYRYITKHTV